LKYFFENVWQEAGISISKKNVHALNMDVMLRVFIEICDLSPVHTKTIVNANTSKRKLFYAFRPSVHTKTMKTLTVNA